MNGPALLTVTAFDDVVRASVGDVSVEGTRGAIREGRVALPVTNVAALGLSLFTDYLLPVELAGTLLLVATIGAIAIASRRPEGLR